MEPESLGKRHKLGAVSGVYIPVCLNIISILMFLRFGLILGQIGLLGILGVLSLPTLPSPPDTLANIPP
jgi:potassium/chloride transporter 9